MGPDRFAALAGATSSVGLRPDGRFLLGKGVDHRQLRLGLRGVVASGEEKDDSAQAAIAALQAGTIDASFRAAGSPASRVPPGIKAAPAADDAHQLLVGPTHPLASARWVTPADIVGQRIWMPGMLPGSEWDIYVDDLADAFGLSIERVGPTSAASTSSTCSPTPRHSRTSLVNTPGFCGPTTTTWAEFPSVIRPRCTRTR